MKLSEKMGQSFRALRKSSDLTLTKIHHLTGASVSNLSKIEGGGAQSVSFELLAQMARALDRHLYEIIAMAEGVELNARSALSTRESELLTCFNRADEAGKSTIELIAASQSTSSTGENL